MLNFIVASLKCTGFVNIYRGDTPQTPKPLLNIHSTIGNSLLKFLAMTYAPVVYRVSIYNYQR